MHCDIKEPNLMIKAADFREPHIVLIDFGIARAMADNVSQTCGTPGYIPPETWDTGKWFPKGDIFSLGVVIVQLMANKLPPLGARTPWTKGGIFLEGCATFPEIQHATKTRHLPRDPTCDENSPTTLPPHAASKPGVYQIGPGVSCEAHEGPPDINAGLS